MPPCPMTASQARFTAMSEESPADEEVVTEPIGLAEFLEAVPPGAVRHIEALRAIRSGTLYLLTPDIQLHCGSEHCGGPRFFSYRGQALLFGGRMVNAFLRYACRNCNSSFKTFAVLAESDELETSGKAIKFGELPVFGPPTPSRLVSLVGPDRDAFLKGRRAENQGLGIGAFAYYRRVVENQKNRLLDEIIRVAERVRSDASTIDALNAAKAENQFAKAVALAKDAIPASLLIDGHNPLTLLHSALSEGLHAQTDEECLEVAASVRVILQELTERTASALKDHAELKSALSRLLSRGARTSDTAG